MTAAMHLRAKSRQRGGLLRQFIRYGADLKAAPMLVFALAVLASIALALLLAPLFFSILALIAALLDIALHPQYRRNTP